MSIFILGLRFLLEISTVVGIVIGALQQSNLILKIIFICIAVAITILWYFFGAPKSATALTGYYKLILELFVYSIGIISFYYLFDFRIATTYTVVVIFDLIMMYVLKLQGH